MRALVVGAGSLGSVYGAALAKAGLDVQLLAREPHARRISEQGGIRITGLPGGTELVRLSASADARSLGPAEVILVAVKSHDTVAALSDIGHVRDQAGIVMSLANGVVKDSLLAGWCGEERVLGMASMVGGTLDEPGQVHCSLPGRTFLGARGGSAGWCGEVTRMLTSGGLPAVAVSDIDAVEWSKLVHASPVMAITALPGLALHQALSDPGLAELYVRAVREGASIAAASGIRLADEEGMFPVRRVASLPTRDAVPLVREMGRAMGGSTTGPVQVSMLEDLRRGRRLEIDDIQGFLVSRAREHSIDVPVTRTLLQLLRSVDRAQGGAVTQ